MSSKNEDKINWLRAHGIVGALTNGSVPMPPMFLLHKVESVHLFWDTVLPWLLGFQ